MGDREGDEIGKIFVGGLTRETDENMLKNHFSEWGEIHECVVMKDKLTDMSRGFGFVKYIDPASVGKALNKDNGHYLDNKRIDPKPCTPKNVQQQKKIAANEHTQTHKIFIGGIAQNATKEEVESYFKQYGVVNEVVFVINKDEGRHKGFGFVTFDEESSVNQAVDKHFHDICGKKVEAKRATPRDKMPPGGRGGQESSEGYGGNYGYGYGAAQGQGGWMPPQGNGNGMMGYGYGYGQGYATSYPQSYGGQQSYYGYNYNPGMAYGGMGQASKGPEASGGYGGMGNYQQQSSGYGPTRGAAGAGAGAYGGSGQQEFGNGYGRSSGDGSAGGGGGGAAAGGGGSGGGGGGRGGSGQAYHPYKR